tara:strand:+ start:652 stop:1296 length:645 start_codon:yes stop_codon:yes gene_type:complete
LETQRLAEAKDRNCSLFIADLTDIDQTIQACNEIRARYDRIDILINNAGGGVERSPLPEADIMLWWKTIETNLKSTAMVTRFLHDLLPDGGKIINVSSGMGLSPGSENDAYRVAKAGVHILTESLALQLWDRGIDVNNLVPGPVATSTFNQDDPSNRLDPADIMTLYEDGPPPQFPSVERVKHPDEVANLALYIATFGKGGPNGQTFSLARRPL